MSGDKRHLYLVPELRWKAFNLLSLSIISTMGFFADTPLQVEDFFSFPVSWKFSSWVDIEFCAMLFLHLVIWFLFFTMFIWQITLIEILILKKPCIPGIKPTWSRHIILYIYCWIIYANVLLKISVSIFMKHISLQFSFLYCFCLALTSRW